MDNLPTHKVSGIRKHSYLNQAISSRCLEREAGPNVELMWLIDRLAPDLKTIRGSGSLLSGAAAKAASMQGGLMS